MVRTVSPRCLKHHLACLTHLNSVIGLCLGWPVQERQINPRLPLDATYHVDTMGDDHDDAAVVDFDRRYVTGRQAVLPPSAPAPRAWSAERTEQYAKPQRADWGAFVRSRKFGLD